MRLRIGAEWRELGVDVARGEVSSWEEGSDGDEANIVFGTKAIPMPLKAKTVPQRR